MSRAASNGHHDVVHFLRSQM